MLLCPSVLSFRPSPQNSCSEILPIRPHHKTPWHHASPPCPTFPCWVLSCGLLSQHMVMADGKWGQKDNWKQCFCTLKMGIWTHFPKSVFVHMVIRLVPLGHYNTNRFLWSVLKSKQLVCLYVSLYFRSQRPDLNMVFQQYFLWPNDTITLPGCFGQLFRLSY